MINITSLISNIDVLCILVVYNKHKEAKINIIIIILIKISIWIIT